MWRDAKSVYLQPLIGRTRRYRSVAEAIRALTPPRHIVVTDVTAPHWPNHMAAAAPVFSLAAQAKERPARC